MSTTDVLSSLPEPILHHILLFLPARCAAQTSVLSKLFCHTWRSLGSSVFNLNESHFIKNLPLAERKKFPVEKQREKFARFVDDALRRLHNEKVIIQKFKLKVSLPENVKHASRVKQWIALAARNKVNEFDIRVKYEGMELQLPPSLFANNSFSKLRLRHCELPVNMNLPWLKVLHLKLVEINEQVLQKLIDSSPFLEKFVLTRSGEFKRLQILNRPSLKIVVVEGVSQLKIQAPTLEKFHFSGDKFELDVAAWRSLKELGLCSQTVNNESIKEAIRKCPRLERLELSPMVALDTVRVSSRGLTDLKLDLVRFCNPKVWIDTPNLGSFTVWTSEIPNFSSTSNSRIPQAEVHLLLDMSLDTTWFNKLRTFLGKFQNCKVLKLTSLGREFEFLRESKWGRQVPPLPKVETLKLHVMNTFENYSALLDGLFWTCHPDVLSISPYSPWNRQVIEFLFETLKRRGQGLQQCCWKHDLKDFEIIQGFPGVKDVKALTGAALGNLLNEKVTVKFKLTW